MDGRFRYVAIDAAGRRVRGVLTGVGEEAVFAQLKRDGLSPLRIARTGPSKKQASGAALSDRESADFLSDAAALLKAGSDLRTVLKVLGGRFDRGAVRSLCRALDAEISGGGAVDRAFAKALPKRHAFVAALIAAGEASGDLAGGLARAADLLSSRLKLREQLVSALSYPAFVLASTVAAALVILLFLVPSLAPLAEASQADPPLALGLLMAVSDILRGNLAVIAVGVLGLTAAGVVAARAGALSALFDRLLLDGPWRGVTSGLVYGGFAISLGDMLAAGAPMTEALRLAIRTVRSPLGRARLEPVLAAVRQGESLSVSLERAPGFPPAIARLGAVGEASGALGPSLARAGRFEEQTALRRIEAAGKMLGPLMILLLGGLIGLMMAGLLTGIQEIGDTALQ